MGLRWDRTMVGFDKGRSLLRKKRKRKIKSFKKIRYTDKRQNDKRRKRQTSERQTSERTNVGSDKRRKRQTSERQTSEATNVGSDKHQKITKFNSVNFCMVNFVQIQN